MADSPLQFKETFNSLKGGQDPLKSFWLDRLQGNGAQWLQRAQSFASKPTQTDTVINQQPPSGGQQQAAPQAQQALESPSQLAAPPVVQNIQPKQPEERPEIQTAHSMELPEMGAEKQEEEEEGQNDGRQAVSSALNAFFNTDNSSLQNYQPEEASKNVLAALGQESPEDIDAKWRDYYAQQGVDFDSQPSWTDQAIDWITKAGTDEAKAGGERTYDHFTTGKVDDGTNKAENVNSNFVTKDRLLDYDKAGVIDLEQAGLMDTIKNAEDSSVFDKSKLHRENGIDFYSGDDPWTRLGQNAESLMTVIPTLTQKGLQARTKPGYKIYVDDREYGSQSIDEASDYFKDAKPSKARFTNDDGETVFEMDTDDDFADQPATQDYETGDITISTKNGKQITLTQDQYYSVFNEDGSIKNQKNIKSVMDDFTASDGTKIPYDDYFRIAEDQAYMSGNKKDADDPGVNYDFTGNIGFLPVPNFAKPQAFVKDPIQDVGDIAPYLYDLLVGSAPYMIPYANVPTGISRAYMSSMMLDPDSMNEDGSFDTAKIIIDDETAAQLKNQGVDVDKYLADLNSQDMVRDRIIGNALMPFVEKFGGINSSKWMKALNEAVDKKLGRPVWGPVAQFLSGVNAEGLEEIVQNINEEIASNGGGDYMYGDYYTDQNGQLLSDSAGRPLPIPGESTEDKWFDLSQDPNNENTQRSWLGDAPEAYVGGATLGALLSSLTELPPAIYWTKERLKTPKGLRNMEGQAKDYMPDGPTDIHMDFMGAR